MGWWIFYDVSIAVASELATGIAVGDRGAQCHEITGRHRGPQAARQSLAGLFDAPEGAVNVRAAAGKPTTRIGHGTAALHDDAQQSALYIDTAAADAGSHRRPGRVRRGLTPALARRARVSRSTGGPLRGRGYVAT